MAQKEIDFHDFITPYDWSYSHDTGLKETMKEYGLTYEEAKRAAKMGW